jgi:hypothetical protein
LAHFSGIGKGVGALGLLIGIGVPLIGIAAAAGLTPFSVGASPISERVTTRLAAACQLCTFWSFWQHSCSVCTVESQWYKTST